MRLPTGTLINNQGAFGMKRRDVLKAMGATAAGFMVGNAPTAEAADPTAEKNPYGGVPSGGHTFSGYFPPTPHFSTNNIYYPAQEEIGPYERAISVISNTPLPATRSQARTLSIV